MLTSPGSVVSSKLLSIVLNFSPDGGTLEQICPREELLVRQFNEIYYPFLALVGLATITSTRFVLL